MEEGIGLGEIFCQIRKRGICTKKDNEPSWGGTFLGQECGEAALREGQFCLCVDTGSIQAGWV